MFWLFLKMGLTNFVSKPYTIGARAPNSTFPQPTLGIPCSQYRCAMVNKDSQLLQRRLADQDRARRYCRTCAEALGPPADSRCGRQRLQHQHWQARHSEHICRALPARVRPNDDNMDVDHVPVYPPPPPAYLLSHQTDAINNFFTRFLFTQDNPPECSMCFERYHGMRMQGTQCGRCHREILSHPGVHQFHRPSPLAALAHCPPADFPPLHRSQQG